MELKTDLGIKFDPKLSFNEHVLYVVNLAYRNLGFIIRNSKPFKNMETLLTLYSSFVRSRLEYCSIVWCPFYTKYIQALENIQKKFIKHSNFILNGVYGSNSEYLLNLTRYNLMTLYNRRVYYSIIYLYKIINNLTYDSDTLEKISIGVPNLQTRFNRTFYLPILRKNYVMRSPIYTMMSNYNNFQQYCDIFGDHFQSFVKKIKSRLYEVSNNIDIYL